MDGYSDEIIDLTDSFTLANHGGILSDVVIEVDSSFRYTPSLDTSNKTAKRKKRRISEKLTSQRQRLSSPGRNSEEHGNSKKAQEIPRFRSWGDCPICWDELGKNSLASTKCGHVFCLKCIQKSLKTQKSCPTCRHVLIGSSAYHPLYLNI